MKYPFITFAFLFLISCSEEVKEKETPVASVSVIADSLFAFHNIKSTDFVKNFWYDENDHFATYADSTKKLKLVKMDSLMKKKVLIPMLSIDASYVIQYMDAVFISKQDSIGPYTPIIVKLSGDDYDEVMMLLLNDKGDPVSKLRLYGGECGGPDEAGGNDLIELCPYQQSSFSGDTIHSYILHVFQKASDEHSPSVIDSISLMSTVGTNGQFTTTKKDSVHYSRVFTW